MKKTVLSLLFLLLIIPIYSIETPYYEIDAYKFKRYLEDGKIKEVSGGGYDVEGTYENDKGELVNFRVKDLYNNNPFLNDAIKKQGLQLGPRYVVEHEEYGFVLDTGDIISISVIGTIIILLLLNFIMQIRLYRVLKRKT